MNDKAIEYNAKLQKTKSTLERMQRIGLNVSIYNELLDSINSELEEAKANNIKTLFANNMATDVLNMSYSKAINKLDIMFAELSKYNIYLKVASFCGSLRMFLTNSNYNKEELEEFRVKILDLLQGIKDSNTLEYEVEGHLVEDIYHLTYEFIKIEISLTGNSVILDKIRNNTIDVSYIEKEIIRELESLNLKEPKYQGLLTRKYAIESLGINASYVDYELIKLIVTSTISYEEKRKLAEELSAKLDTYYQDALNTKKRVETAKKSLLDAETSHQNLIKNNQKKLMVNGIRFFLSLGMSISIAISVLKFAQKKSTAELYKTTTTTYSTISDTLIEEEYKRAPKEEVILYAYHPYEEYISKYYNYRRQIEEYDLTSNEHLSFEEYLSLDLEKLGVTPTRKYSNLEKLSLQDAYDEVYYVLKEVTVDENDKIITQDTHRQIMDSITFLIICLVIDTLYEIGLGKIFKEKTKYWGFIDSLIFIRQTIMNIRESKKTVEEKRTELNNLYKYTIKLMEDNYDIIAKLSSLLEADNENSSQIEQNLTRVRQLNEKLQELF